MALMIFNYAVNLFRITVIVASLVLTISTAATVDVDSSSTTATYPAIRDELLIRNDIDQKARWDAIELAQQYGIVGAADEDSPVEAERALAELWAGISNIDADNTVWLKGIVNEIGWPAYSDVGKDGGEAAWLLVQHADADPKFQRQCLDLMAELPKDEISQSNFAYLTDRVLLAEDQKQVYGTQFVAQDGKWVPAPLEAAESVDERRAEVGLPPLAEYAAMLEEMMKGEEGGE
jgi:hypothetical protein